jgi:peptidoglycan/LPS O-acetylase OafA/YrhL
MVAGSCGWGVHFSIQTDAASRCGSTQVSVAMKANIIVLIILLVTHAVLGAEYGRYSPDDEGSDRTLRWYVLISHALLALWAFFDARAAGRKQSLLAIGAIALFGFLAALVYVGANRPAGTWTRWLSKAIAYFFACIFIFGEAFQRAFESSTVP